MPTVNFEHEITGSVDTYFGRCQASMLRYYWEKRAPLKPLPIFAKKLHHICLMGPKYVSNLFFVNIPTFYSLRISENLWFSDVFRGHKMGNMTRYGLMKPWSDSRKQHVQSLQKKIKVKSEYKTPIFSLITSSSSFNSHKSILQEEKLDENFFRGCLG